MPGDVAAQSDDRWDDSMKRAVIVAMALLLIAGSSLFLFNPAQSTAPSSVHDLTIPTGDPNWEKACHSAIIPNTTPACTQAALFDLNLARRSEGLARLTLPRGFSELRQARQLIYLVNNERTIRNLPSVEDSSPQLELLARQAANQARDPAIPPSMDGGSDWAGNFPNAIVVVFMWMYEDGYRYTNGGGGSNLDCQSPKSSGCWGHRAVILENSSTDTHYGAAFTTQLTPSQSLEYADSYTLVLAGPPAPFAIGDTGPLARTIVVVAILMILGSAIAWLTGRRRQQKNRQLGPPPPSYHPWP